MSAIHTLTRRDGVTHEELEDRYAEKQTAMLRLVQKDAVQAYRLGYADGQKDRPKRKVQK